MDRVEASAFRLPADIRIGRVVLQIASLARSLGWYRDVLGFRVLSRSAGTAQLGAHGQDGTVLELHEKSGARPVPHRGRLGLYHFAVLLPSAPDLGRFLRHVTGLDVQLGASDHGVSEALYLTDPDGITMEVYRDRPREEWPVRNGEIAMGILPLDGAALLDAAGTEPWHGFPAGTTVGHMHFYVGDIAVAQTFYLDGLGFERVVAIPGALFVSAGGYHHHVGVNTWAAGSPIATDDDARLLFWELIVPAAARAAAAASLRRAGYDVATAAGVHSASDAWGNTVRLLTHGTAAL